MVGETVTEDPESIKSLKNEFGSGDILYGKLRPNLNKVWLSDRNGICSTDIYVISPKQDDVVPELYACIFRGHLFNDAVVKQVKGAQLPRVGWDAIARLEIPLPPLEVQREIVAEIEGYQRVIDGARAVVDNWRPQFVVESDWPLVELGNPELFRIESGGTPKSGVKRYWDGGVPWITLMDLPPDNLITEIRSTERTISEDGLRSSSAKLLPAHSVVVSSRATIGRIGINRIPLATNQGFKNVIIENEARAIPEYVAQALTKLVPIMQANASGATYKEITKTRFGQLCIPLPPLETQRAIVAELDEEQAAVDQAKRLAGKMAQRIQDVISRVWAAQSNQTAQ